MFNFFSRSKGRPKKEDTSLLSSRVEDSPTVIYDYGTRRAFTRNMHGDDPTEEEEGDNLQYEDVEEEEDGDEDEDDIDADTPLLPIFSSAYLGETVLYLI